VLLGETRILCRNDSAGFSSARSRGADVIRSGRVSVVARCDVVLEHAAHQLIAHIVRAHVVVVANRWFSRLAHTVEACLQTIARVGISAARSVFERKTACITLNIADVLSTRIPVVGADDGVAVDALTLLAQLHTVAEQWVRARSPVFDQEVAGTGLRVAKGFNAEVARVAAIDRCSNASAVNTSVVECAKACVVAGLEVGGVDTFSGLTITRIVGARVVVTALPAAPDALAVQAEALVVARPLAVRAGCVVRQAVERAPRLRVARCGRTRISIIAHHGVTLAYHAVAAGCADVVGRAQVVIVTAHTFVLPIADAWVGIILLAELVAPRIPARQVGFAHHVHPGQA